jgi:membrane protease YdiL (CAAX protease family)
MRLDLADIVFRLTLVARGLGFVFLVYFIPVVARDLLGETLPGGGLPGLLSGNPEGAFWPAVLSGSTLAVSAAAVLLYSRTGYGAARPKRLLWLDRPWFREWGRGFAIGAIAATIVLAPLFLVGALRIDSVSSAWREQPTRVLAVLVTLFFEAAREEFGFRGPAQRDISAALTFPIAAIFLSGSFAVIHGGNPDIGSSGLLGVFLAGLALAGLARARGDLGMVCGVHAGWNVFTAMVWSVAVSGFQLDVALFEVSSTGSELWTGGAFGVEGSLPGIVVFLVLAFVSWSLPAAASGSPGLPIDRETTGSSPPEA